jgi:hypothetical protein
LWQCDEVQQPKTEQATDFQFVTDCNALKSENWVRQASRLGCTRAFNPAVSKHRLQTRAIDQGHLDGSVLRQGLSEQLLSALLQCSY